MITIMGASGNTGNPLARRLLKSGVEVAGLTLRERDFDGIRVRELLGERDLTFAEATRVIGDRVGLPDLEYVQFPTTTTPRHSPTPASPPRRQDFLGDIPGNRRGKGVAPRGP